MAIELVEVTKNTRGLNSREIKYKAIGKYITKTVERESKPLFNADGTPQLDDKGNQKREPLGKDADGKQIIYKEDIQEFTSEGVLTDVADAMELVNGDEQTFLDCFAEGFNARQYEIEASKDELDEFMKDMTLDEDARKVFKRTVNQLSRGTGMELLAAADFVKTAMTKKAAK